MTKQSDSTPIVKKENGSLGSLEKVLIQGDLSKLTEQERILYYMKICESLSLNPLTKPFEYFEANGKLILGAKKGCSEQLRNIHDVSIIDLRSEERNNLLIYWATALLPSGRKDTSSGVVSIEGLKGKTLANAIMTAETKAKNRVTLSLFGLGLLDETEIETIPNRTIIKTPTGIFSHEPVTYKINREPDDYRKKIESLGDPELIKAYRDGDWNTIPDAVEMDKGNFLDASVEGYSTRITENYIEKEDYILATGKYKGKTLRQAAIDDNDPTVWETFVKWVNKFGENGLKQIPARDMGAIRIFLGG